MLSVKLFIRSALAFAGAYFTALHPPLYGGRANQPARNSIEFNLTLLVDLSSLLGLLSQLLPYLYVSRPTPPPHRPTYAQMVSLPPTQSNLHPKHTLISRHHTTPIPKATHSSLEPYITSLFTKAKKEHLLAPNLIALVCSSRQSSTLTRYLAYHRPWLEFATKRHTNLIPMDPFDFSTFLIETSTSDTSAAPNNARCAAATFFSR